LRPALDVSSRATCGRVALQTALVCRARRHMNFDAR
jgi:hypothetical protein